MLLVGVLGMAFPEVMVQLIHTDGAWHARHEGGSSRLAFIVMRIFGVFLAAQAWVVFVLR
jgi:hypothetical protein